MDVGRAARRRPQRHAAVPDRPGPASRHPRPDADRDPATTAPGRARPAHLARPRSYPATTTRPAEPAGRPGPAAGTPRTHLTAQPYPNEQGPGDTDPDVGCFCTPTPTRTMQRQRSRRPEQDHSVSGGSRSDGLLVLGCRRRSAKCRGHVYTHMVLTDVRWCGDGRGPAAEYTTAHLPGAVRGGPGAVAVRRRRRRRRASPTATARAPPRSPWLGSCPGATASCRWQEAPGRRMWRTAPPPSTWS